MKILGIDYGRKKMGLAVGETETGLVEPYGVWPSSILRLRSGQEFNVQNSKLIKEQEIEKIVIGLTGGEIDKEIQLFGRDLEKTTGLPVDFMDETLTTQGAQRELIASGRKRKARQKMEDAIAAAIMLEWYLERGKDNV